MRLPSTPAVVLSRQLRDEIRRDHRAGRVIVGVDGDGAAPFADGLARAFAEQGVAVVRAGMDDFHHPRARRYARGRGSGEGYYRDSYDYATFRRVLTDPFRDGAQTGGSTGFQLAAFDLARDAAVDPQWVTAPRDAVLIVDGVFLHRPELRGVWDWSVWLDAPLRRVRADGDQDTVSPATRRVVDGRALYLAEAQPEVTASAVVDNTDPALPLRLPDGAAR